MLRRSINLRSPITKEPITGTARKRRMEMFSVRRFARVEREEKCRKEMGEPQSAFVHFADGRARGPSSTKLPARRYSQSKWNNCDRKVQKADKKTEEEEAPAVELLRWIRRIRSVIIARSAFSHFDSFDTALNSLWLSLRCLFLLAADRPAGNSNTYACGAADSQ